MDRFDPFVKYADVYGDIINWEKDPMNKPQNQNKYFFSDGKTYYEQICKMLRLMSVFKEAFNQIYSNEDEISEAWENFVNNLSASVVEGSEPDVTLTWTDDSVNFEFTMVPGVPGDPGVGITSISFNSDYTMTITLSDGNTYTSMSLKGETGPQGPQGETGSGLQILDVYPTLADLQSAHPTGQPGDAYQVGSAGSYTLYIWSSSQSAWVPAGSLGTVSPSVSNPLMDGTASAGSLDQYSRGDHVHPTDTSRASKEELDALIKTSQALIDQSFTYRESPAIQDGLARIDKIKGNTLVWNQQMPISSVSSFSDVGITANNSNDGGYVINGTATSVNFNYWLLGSYTMSDNVVLALKKDHKYLSKSVRLFETASNTGVLRPSPNVELETWSLFTVTISDAFFRAVRMANLENGKTYSNYKVYPMIIDLTQMGLDSITDASEFTSLFPLPYYEYNAGSLLSFNGTALKTTGKNLFHNTSPSAVNNGITWSVNEDGSVTANGTCVNNVSVFKMYTQLLRKGTYIINGTPSGASWGGSNPTWRIRLGHQDGSYINDVYAEGRTFTLTEDEILEIQCNMAVGKTVSNQQWLPMIRFADATDATFEPYKESSLSLPISTYFPTGMKSSGTVYDEQTESKATKRLELFEITSSNIQSGYLDTQNNQWLASVTVPDIKQITDASVKANIICNTLETKNQGSLFGEVGSAIDLLVNSTNVRITIKGITTFADMQTWLDNNQTYFIYELATPVETAVDLDLSFKSYLDGTEQLLPVNGSVPSTSPIIADMTYLSIDDAMEYVLEKLANVPLNTQQILESLEYDVDDLQTDVGALQTSVSGLQTSVGNINTNIGQLSSTVAGHTASISSMQSDITDLNTGLSDLEDTVTDNTSRIGTLETGLTNTDSEVDAIDARVLNLETDLLKVVQKEYDYESVAGNTNFGVQTGLQQEPGYKIVGIVGSEVQQGEYTSTEPWIIVTQAHIHYTSTGGVILSMMARNVSEYTKTNVRVYLYVLCIKDTQSE